MADKIKTVKYEEVIAAEAGLLRKRREQLFGKEEAEKMEVNRFGIALSGGGIRSATINLGFLKTMNRFGILQKADYLSTVSGGGYTGAYVQTALKNGVPYEELFQDKHINHLKEKGAYLVPGKGLRKLWNQFLLVVGFVFSLLMSWLSPLVIIALVYGAYRFLDHLILFREEAPQMRQLFLDQLFLYGGISLLGIMLIHFLFNVLKNFNLDLSLGLHKVEAVAVLIGLCCFVGAFFLGFKGINDGVFQVENFALYLMVAVLLGIMGMFTNPNATSFHRFYRQRLSDAFMGFAGKYKNVLLKDLFQVEEAEKRHYNAPYPLVNTCLNLQSSNDPNFMGTKASDYFLLSPLYCGAKLTEYVSTKDTYMYDRMTFPAAITVSAAAVNPGMGVYSNKILSILTTVLNLRLGYWMPNPLKLKETHPLVWWPLYFFYELLSQIGTDNKMLNISDGGHIENLAVYELLRRKCRLIIAVDAGEDPNFIFEDLENLTIRARNELGLDIRFRKGNIPEDTIRPKPSHGYSSKRFAIADIYQLWEKVMENGKEVIKHYDDKKVGTFVYAKSSVTAPLGRPNITREGDPIKYNTYKYKIYHPEFPHESTADQFFDETQWASYYKLGQYLAADVLGIDNFADYDEKECPEYQIDQLMRLFNPALRTMPEVVPLAPRPRSRGVEVEARSLKLDQKGATKEVDKEVPYKM